MPRKLAWVAVLYFAQGLPYGIASKVWPVYFRLHGVALAQVGLLSLLFLPYTLKPAWAPLVDRFGRRQQWIAGCLAALTVLTLVLAGLDPGGLRPGAGLLLWGVLLAFTLASATQDIAIDGWAVDLIDTRQHLSSDKSLDASSDVRGTTNENRDEDAQRAAGPINGMRVAAYRVALVAAGGLLLVLADVFPWPWVWATTAGLLALLAIVAWISPGHPEPPPSSAPRARPRAGPRLRRWRSGLLAATGAAWVVARIVDFSPMAITGAALVTTLAVAAFLDPRLLRWLGRREMIPAMALVALYKLGDSALLRMVEPFWVDRGFSPTEIGVVSSTVGMLLTVVGALAGGVWVARRGVFSALLWFGIAQAVSNFAYVAVAVFPWPRESIYGAAVVESLTQGLGTAAFLSFLMILCTLGDDTVGDEEDQESGGVGQNATRFALLTGLYALSRDFTGALSGIGVEAWGYGGYFLVTALLALPGLGLLGWVRPLTPHTKNPSPQ